MKNISIPPSHPKNIFSHKYRTSCRTFSYQISCCTSETRKITNFDKKKIKTIFFHLSVTRQPSNNKDMKFFIILLIISTTSGLQIDCHFSYDHVWHEIGQVYTCEVISMDFSDNSTDLTSYSGTHVPGNSADDVKAFYFGTLCPQFGLTFVPRGFLNFFPNFNMLEFNTCTIDTLDGDELDEYPNLERFVLVHSSVQRIPGNLFEFNKNLRYIWFGFRIMRVGDNLLDDLENLDQAYFWDNSCINQTALTPEEVPALIEGLKIKCPDVDPTTSTESTTTTEKVCEVDDLESFVCGLSEEIYSWKINYKELKDEILNLREENENLKEIVEDLSEKNEELEKAVEDLGGRVESLESLVLRLR